MTEKYLISYKSTRNNAIIDAYFDMVRKSNTKICNFLKNRKFLR